MRNSGEASIWVPAPGSPTAAMFLAAPFLTQLQSPAGSLMGGNPLTLYTNASTTPTAPGAAPSLSLQGFNPVNASANVILLGGIPCDVTNVTANSITCLPGPAVNLVLAE